MKLAKAKKAMATRRDVYCVGYVGRKNLIFGTKTKYEYKNAAKPMTLRQAKRMLLTMPCGGCAIFKLAPVAVNR